MSRRLRRLPWALAAALAAPPACGKSAERAPAERAPAAAPPAACAALTTHATGAIAWVEDDYAGALACARARGVPLVLDLWAPWCHTCLSMKTTVFPDASLGALAPGFVFAALDTDREGNAAAVARYPLSAWPTFYVVSPDEAVLARFVGAASVPQFRAFLEAGAAAQRGVDGAAARLLEAERAIAAKDLPRAEEALGAALAAAPAGWVRRPDALVSLIHTRDRRGDDAGCLALAEATLGASPDPLGAAASTTDFLGIALGCATALAPSDAPRAAAFRERALARLRALLADPAAQLSTDDRSDAMAYLRELLDTLGRPAEARAVAEQQRALLEDAAARAPTPAAASTYNWQRAEVHVYLGRPLDIVPALERSAKDLPTEYDPPARLGWVYWKAGKLPEAARWTDAALALAYGPRKARLLTQRADIAAAAGDPAAERRARQDLVALWAAMPPGQANPDALAKAQAALAAMEAGSGSGSGSGR